MHHWNQRACLRQRCKSTQLVPKSLLQVARGEHFGTFPLDPLESIYFGRLYALPLPSGIPWHPPLRGVALVLDEDPVRPKTQTWGQVGKSCPRYRSMMVYVPDYTLGMRQDRCIRVLLSDLFGHWHFGSRCGCRPGWSETKINSAWSCQVDLIVFSPQNKTNSASVALIGWLFQLRLVL